jgi:hypothetical protein
MRAEMHKVDNKKKHRCHSEILLMMGIKVVEKLWESFKNGNCHNVFG